MNAQEHAEAVAHTRRLLLALYRPVAVPYDYVQRTTVFVVLAHLAGYTVRGWG